MKLNLDFYNENDENISEREKEQVEKYFVKFNNNLNIDELPIEDNMLFNFNRKNIVSWYDFKKNANILELNPNLGEITGFLCEISKKVISITESKIKGEAIKNRYEKNRKLEVVVGNLNNIIIDEKFDYAVIIGVDKKEVLVEKIKFAKKYIKEDGKILIAFDNKFGIKYWAGIKENARNQYDQIIGRKDKISLADIKNILKQEKMNAHFFYPLPDYKITNVIYSDSYLPNVESINARHLPFYNKEDYCNFAQRDVYSELIIDNPENFKFFSNAYFIEIFFDNNFIDTKYVNFEIIRKEKYAIKTVIKEDYVYKIANTKKAENHINVIKKNIDVLNKYNINTLDSYDKGKIISKYAKNAISLDRYIVKVCKEKGIEEGKKILIRFIKEILGKFEEIEKPEKNIFKKYNIKIKNPEKLHFIKDGLIDLCPQNCFYINDNFYIYDQEWYEENIPIEFVIYRIILFSDCISEYISKDELYELFGISKYVDVFYELEETFQNSIKNKYIWDMYINSIHNIGKMNREITELNKAIIQLKYSNSVDCQVKNIEDYYKNEIKKYQNDINNYKEQITIIENSLSWKITKPLRYISWLFKRNYEVSFKDRLFPAGSKRREKLDVYKKQQIIKHLKNKYKNMFSNEIIERFIELETDYIDEKQKNPHKTNYDFWVDNNIVTTKELFTQSKCEFKYMPKISIITSLYNINIDFFKEMIYFLLEQSYSNWELCIADRNKKPLNQVQDFIKNEPRIKYKFVGGNKGISESENLAIEMATGDYVGFLNQEDSFAKNCLYEVVKLINEDNSVEFIYSDEDKMLGVGKQRFSPNFKPDFSIDTLRCQNYIGHFSVIKKAVLDKLNGFDSKYDGAHEYELFLRMTEIVNSNKIKHISKVLYHLRESDPNNTEESTLDIGKLAVENHFKRLNLDATVKKGKATNSYEVEYKVKGKPKVSIMIPNKDGIDILKTCVESILEKTTYSNYEINIIENNSIEQETFDYYKELEKNSKINILWYPEKGFNYSRIINFGARNSDGDYLVQLNNDTEVITSNWLEKMIGYCQRDDVGAVGVSLYYPDNSYQHAGITIGVGGIAANRFKDISKDKHGYMEKESRIENLSAVTAACIMTKRSIYEEVRIYERKIRSCV